ncbi:hypothetical protein K438DRAFT_306625 [Mycena galopus ATCC 62051]|nr:hypothetical protein K438DRAFT_306625 [Mycena galopus ATCC 62051]
MRHRSFLQHPNLDPSYHIDNTASTSLSLGHILQPQPMRPIPRSLARKADWRVAPQDDDRTYLDEDSFAATCFPAPENTLGLFSTDPKYSAVAGSSGYHPRHMPTPPTRRKIEDYEREGGWSFDAIGQTHYVPHAGIMVVDEDDKNLAIPDSFLEQELPPDTTPPPRPKQRPIELIPLPVLDRLPLGPLGDKSKTRIGPPPRTFSASICLTTWLPKILPHSLTSGSRRIGPRHVVKKGLSALFRPLTARLWTTKPIHTLVPQPLDLTTFPLPSGGMTTAARPP